MCKAVPCHLWPSFHGSDTSSAKCTTHHSLTMLRVAPKPQEQGERRRFGGLHWSPIEAPDHSCGPRDAPHDLSFALLLRLDTSSRCRRACPRRPLARSPSTGGVRARMHDGNRNWWKVGNLVDIVPMDGMNKLIVLQRERPGAWMGKSDVRLAEWYGQEEREVKLGNRKKAARQMDLRTFRNAAVAP